ncbi:hypothetical protein RFI_24240, partial [Reticulomyxa filosa]
TAVTDGIHVWIFGHNSQGQCTGNPNDGSKIWKACEVSWDKQSNKRVAKICASSFCTLVLAERIEDNLITKVSNLDLFMKPTYVDERAIAYLCDIALSSGNIAKLSSTLRMVFSSPSLLNGSFPTNRNMYHLLPGTGVDLESLQKMYNRLLNIDPRVSNAFIKAMSHVVKNSGRHVHYQQEALRLRYYFILIVFPELLNASFNHEMTSLLNDSITRISDDLKQDMVEWLMQWDVFSRRLLLQRLQDCLTMFVELKEKIDMYVFRIVMVMDYLWRANQRLPSSKDRLALKEFYNRTLTRSGLIDYRSDFIRWREGSFATTTTTNTAGLNSRGRGNIFAFCMYPFLLDPVAKREVIEIEQQLSRQQHALDGNLNLNMIMGFNLFFPIPQPYFVIRVRRPHLLPDTLAIVTHTIANSPNDFFKELKVVFEGEEAVDQGGVKKEFFQLIIEELFDIKYGCFNYNENTCTYWFNSHSFEDENTFRLLGIIIGLGIYNGVLLDIRFPLVVYKKLCGEKVGLDELKDMDSTIGKSVEEVMKWPESGRDVKDLCLVFCVEDQVFGEVQKHDLISNGESIDVTNENVLNYVDKLVNWYLNESIAKQFEPFAKGFHMVVGKNAFRLFMGEELEKLVVGNTVLDFDALEVSTKYEGGYHSDHPSIRLFWRVAKSFDEENKKKLLFFVTGSHRAPLRGLGKLGLVIHRVGSDPYDGEMLPTAHTCFNTLMLPAYPKLEIMEEKLTLAIKYSQGFGLQ